MVVSTSMFITTPMLRKCTGSGRGAGPQVDRTQRGARPDLSSLTARGWAAQRRDVFKRAKLRTQAGGDVRRLPGNTSSLL